MSKELLTGADAVQILAATSPNLLNIIKTLINKGEPVSRIVTVARSKDEAGLVTDLVEKAAEYFHDTYNASS